MRVRYKILSIISALKTRHSVSLIRTIINYFQQLSQIPPKLIKSNLNK